MVTEHHARIGVKTKAKFRLDLLTATWNGGIRVCLLR